ncbi:hypothetical protein [Agromyces marinus]|nr:hypothetical protein [Agromyces marinus]UIP57703.1 hypothetical protein DSM26151_05680 [Agromyces marinus]
MAGTPAARSRVLGAVVDGQTRCVCAAAFNPRCRLHTQLYFETA